MTGREAIVGVIEDYCRFMSSGDKPAWLSLFSPRIVHEDPIGTPSNRGIEQVAAFWDAIEPLNVEIRLNAPVVVCGRHAIAPIMGWVGPADDRKETGQVYDHFVFDEDAKIVELRAIHEFG